MVSPVRIKGETGTSSTSTPRTVIEVNSPAGVGFTLAGERNQPAFIIDGTLSGFEGSAEWSFVESVTKYGDRRVGWKIPAAESSFEFGLRDKAGVSDLYRLFRKAFADGSIMSVCSYGGVFHSRIEGAMFGDVTSDLSRLRFAQGKVDFRRPDGCWFGEVEEFTGTKSVSVDGDYPLSPSCRLRWDGTASTVKFPTGVTVTFPELGSPRYINLDYGMSAQVTREDGSVDTSVWSGLQGKLFGVTLEPNVPTDWELSAGMVLEVTPRYLSPWR